MAPYSFEPRTRGRKGRACWLVQAQLALGEKSPGRRAAAPWRLTPALFPMGGLIVSGVTCRLDRGWPLDQIAPGSCAPPKGWVNRLPVGVSRAINAQYAPTYLAPVEDEMVRRRYVTPSPAGASLYAFWGEGPPGCRRTTLKDHSTTGDLPRFWNSSQMISNSSGSQGGS